MKDACLAQATTAFTACVVVLGKFAVHVAAREISKGAFGDTHPGNRLRDFGASGPARRHNGLAVG